MYGPSAELIVSQLANEIIASQAFESNLETMLTENVHQWNSISQTKTMSQAKRKTLLKRVPSLRNRKSLWAAKS